MVLHSWVSSRHGRIDVTLASDASPVAVLAQLPEDDHPGALWGDWFGGGIVDLSGARCVCTSRPRRPTASGIWTSSRGLLRAESESGLVGGGWLACFGYDPKTTTMAFYDSLLRWQETVAGRFESLGIERAGARERGGAGVLDGGIERGVIAADQAGTDRTLSASRRMLQYAQDRYLAAVEERDQPDRPRPLLSAEPLYPTACSRCGAPHRSCSGSSVIACSPRSAV